MDFMLFITQKKWVRQDLPVFCSYQIVFAYRASSSLSCNYRLQVPTLYFEVCLLNTASNFRH